MRERVISVESAELGVLGLKRQRKKVWYHKVIPHLTIFSDFPPDLSQRNTGEELRVLRA